MFAFVGYQLYGTGIQTAQAQNRLEDEFEDLLGRPPRRRSRRRQRHPRRPAPHRAIPTSGHAVVPSTTVPAAGHHTPPRATARPAHDPVDRPREDRDRGRAHQRPRGRSRPTSPRRRCPASSATPIAGHRTTHGAPFNRIDEFQVGDDLVVTTLAGRYVYVMTSQQLGAPSDYGAVIPAVDPTKATITLVSCHPRYSTRQRIVVHAELDPTRSDPITAALPAAHRGAERDPPDETLDTEVTTTEPPSTEPETSDPATTDATTTVPATTQPPTTEPPATEDAAGQELFENGRFSDPDAFPHVAAWGVLLSLIAIGSYLISRRFKRNWVGLLVGIVPFVVVLYFWFENVNRLLPPNL